MCVQTNSMWQANSCEKKREFEQNNIFKRPTIEHRAEGNKERRQKKKTDTHRIINEKRDIRFDNDSASLRIEEKATRFTMNHPLTLSSRLDMSMCERESHTPSPCMHV